MRATCRRALGGARSRRATCRSCASGSACMNRTLASQTSLGRSTAPIGRRHLLRKLGRYRRLYARPLPADLAWAQPYADQMRRADGGAGALR